MTVLPMLAPMITPTDCASVSTPAVTKPTTSTVVTDDELSTAVTKAPVSAPVKRLVVSFASAVRSESPAACFRPCDSSSRPARNSASPPNKPMASCSQSSETVGAGVIRLLRVCVPRGYSIRESRRGAEVVTPPGVARIGSSGVEGR